MLRREGALSQEAESTIARAAGQGIEIRPETPREMERMSASAIAPELIALVGAPAGRDLASAMADPGPVFILVGLRYPSNAGFILRSVEVAGAAAVTIASDWQGAQRAQAERVSIRAGRFLPVFDVEPREAISAARKAGRRILALETSGQRAPWQIDWAQPTALLIGGERHGLDADHLAEADETVRIPTRGFIPSYNVQAAVGIILARSCARLRQTPSSSR